MYIIVRGCQYTLVVVVVVVVGVVVVVVVVECGDASHGRKSMRER